ncbi:MAG: class I SAM-dependent methyltransferase [Deltaproteobacteria bacterium]|jgi:SAM-dependent methyltransferase|nr:class I SAM-dependent methyltransferase [Deltaproteobacteria bacterium]
MPGDRNRKLRSYYDDFSAYYDEGRESPYHQMIDDLEIEVATPYARGARVLELGCGTGRLLARLSEVAEEAVGLDLSEGMAAKARARGLRVRIGDLCALPFDDDAFDLVCSFKVLPHVENIHGALREAARVTRPRGYMLLELYNPWSLRFLAKKAVGPRRISDARTEADVFTRWDSPTKLWSLMPPNTEWIEVRGLRVLTPFAAAHRIPLFGTSLRKAERVASRSALRYFGGFLVLVLRKS